MPLEQVFDTRARAAYWGYAAFSGRSAALPRTLTAQDGLYIVVERAAEGDGTRVVGAISRALPGTDTAAWVEALADPQVQVLTLTVTEAAYHVGVLDPAGDAALASDVRAVRECRLDAVRSVPGRVLAALAARHAAGGGPMSIVPCDNLPDNGGVLFRVVEAMAAAADSGLADWISGQTCFVTTMVDRITPATVDADLEWLRRATGLGDLAPGWATSHRW